MKITSSDAGLKLIHLREKKAVEWPLGLTKFGQFEAIFREAKEIRENLGRGFGWASLGGEKHVHRLGAQGLQVNP